ncbi:ribose-5-phosphate isomerase [Sporobacter termitidis DSM 10068]|uniref:Ribose-5-phosphate isomerase n=1 Tax=Sporobacter termitidis DSM 10068 TaxID=1123282 RepID=A0A1M5Z4G1_9FIRM|nr:ribose 5-phosphate isomerase B [Sporobacter termitidis]SHI19152.1 ribose-5-phosphate isomerase [Sporobacter termitidis DSM 10068]
MIALGCDHGGFAMMQDVIKYLDEQGLPYKNFGTFTADSCDYPVIAEAVSRAVTGGECDKGVLICGTGIGMSIAANKFSGIRAALCGDSYSAEMTRRHNDANILVLGARVIGLGLALKILEIFLATPFEGGRHARRIALVSDLEKCK